MCTCTAVTDKAIDMSWTEFLEDDPPVGFYWYHARSARVKVSLDKPNLLFGVCSVYLAHQPEPNQFVGRSVRFLCVASWYSFDDHIIQNTPQFIVITADLAQNKFLENKNYTPPFLANAIRSVLTVWCWFALVRTCCVVSPKRLSVNRTSYAHFCIMEEA